MPSVTCSGIKDVPPQTRGHSRYVRILRLHRFGGFLQLGDKLGVFGGLLLLGVDHRLGGLGDELLVGQLLLHDVFETTEKQKNAWKEEVRILKEQLAEYPDGHIIFEYTIPRIGARIDVTCMINGILFLLEFKGKRAKKP